MQKITPFLWFEKDAEKAAEFYVEVFSKKFPDSAVGPMTYYDESSAKVSGQPSGSIMTVSLKLAGNDFTFINGGAMPKGWSKITGSISFVINCENQDEVDYFWEKLSEGGESSVCGWINRDKFGITWQVTPTILPKLLTDPDKKKAQRAMEAMLKMTKIDIAAIERAIEQN